MLSAILTVNVMVTKFSCLTKTLKRSLDINIVTSRNDQTNNSTTVNATKHHQDDRTSQTERKQHTHIYRYQVSESTVQFSSTGLGAHNVKQLSIIRDDAEFKNNASWDLQTVIYFSSHHSFSLRTCSSSAGVKSFLMLNVLRISSGVLPLIIFATVLHVTSNRPLMSR